MDLRIEKTRRAIKNAFLSLRSEKNLEQITVIELCRAAEIDKSTFYLHYHDLFDLCNQLQQEAVHQLLSRITTPSDVLEDLSEFMRELQVGIKSEQDVWTLLFSGTQRLMFPYLLEQELKDILFNLHPEYRDDVQINVHLSYHIYGSFHAYIENQACFDRESVLRSIRETYHAPSWKDNGNE